MPIILKLTAGQARGGRGIADMLDGMRDGQILLADLAHDSDRLRETVTAQGAWANIRPISRSRNPPAFSAFLYRYRNPIERFFHQLEHYRTIATRYEKHATNNLALVKLASVRIWLRHNESVSQATPAATRDGGGMRIRIFAVPSAGAASDSCGDQCRLER